MEMLVKIATVVLVMVVGYLGWLTFYCVVKMKKDYLKMELEGKCNRYDEKYFGRIVDEQTEKRIVYLEENQFGQIIEEHYTIAFKNFEIERLKISDFDSECFKKETKTVICKELARGGDVIKVNYIKVS